MENIMLYDFLGANRSELIERCRVRVSARRAPLATPGEITHGIPIFLDQLIQMFPKSASNEDASTRGMRTSRAMSKLELDAASHGDELHRHDFTIDQVVHDYGDLCQAITELATDKGLPISPAEFRILNITLDNAIAGAVTRYEVERARLGTLASAESLGELAHEMRNLLNTAILANTAIKQGSVGHHGATAGALDRSLIGMRNLIDRTLVAVRLEAGKTGPLEVIELSPFISDLQVAAGLEASHRGCQLVVSPVEPGLFVEADRHLLASAVANLLQNAFKFTRNASRVTLSVGRSMGRVSIEVQDECGGLPDDMVKGSFHPFGQHGHDRSGMGLGLSMSRKGVEASGGTLSARNVPGGCAFTIDLPQKDLQ
jgi:signal transduction histidine kinase